MYRPPAFREDRPDVIRTAIRAHPLGTLITAGASGLIVNVVPFILKTTPNGDFLQAHLAKANEQIADLREETPALVMFQGPQAYVSPSWYPTKLEHGRVVPTWNYVIIQVWGTPRIIDDTAWLSRQLDELTTIHEQERAEPWSVTDAPDDFLAGQMKGIVGLEVPVDRVEGKWKASQNQPLPNRLGVEQGLRAEGLVELAEEVAARSNGG
ncbi:FMN-binding negative transcriptional regulator [Sphingobium sp. Cam5-1]|uniref:FMN-binding negative transcriptional regulator n=1 Tax=Sphingobium sp. Cam5-1 TaxID=2789327 RepID=UPI0018AD1E27|nr:FMN-binding negative transcriptional regulator [Sphingobium sp. Cam5-1]QPI72629.1 FMN-binding negative transcriptional regulator [Sphingobium sp. Cam5-1]